MRKIIFWVTVGCGSVAAYLLYKRGVAPMKIAQDVFTHPVSTMVNELHTPASQPREA